MKSRIRLSQCMIVKNEERNIRQALSWAKEIAFEQIVVDTGSTDRTVEIARKMGAKVFHFQWIDDFAAAKNYAIEQASGNWIAFLDADEYMNREDARKLMKLLDTVSAPNPQGKIAMMVRCAWIQLDDNGKPFSVDPQDRIFRNRRDIRYHGRIHEQIRIPEGAQFICVQAEKFLTIFHTGYQKRAFEETGKVERNRKLLERELAENPENYDAWCYMGDAKKAEGDLTGAADSYRKAIEGREKGRLTDSRYRTARSGLMSILAERPNSDSWEEMLRLAETYGYPDTDNPDPYFYLGLWHFNRQEMERARELFLKALEKLEAYQGSEKIVTDGYLRHTYVWLAQACLQLKRAQEVIRYCVLALRMDRFQDKVLTSVLQLLKQEPGEAEQAEGTWKFLAGLYDFTSMKDLLFVFKCARLAGFTALEDRILALLPEEERKPLLRRPETEEGSKETFGIEEKNEADRRFLFWARHINKSSEKQLLEEMKERLMRWKREQPPIYTKYIEYYEKYPLWGRLYPDQEDYETLFRRAHMMKEHLKDLIWLYQLLADYRSKTALLAILLNWTFFNIRLLGDVKERSSQYFDLDLFPSAEGEVFVDLGAYIGDTIGSLTKLYGMVHQKIYAYEPDRRNAEFLLRNTKDVPNVELRVKGAGQKKGMTSFAQAQEASSSRIVKEGEGVGEEVLKQEQIEIVTLDEDIKEPVTWIKMDIEGAEYDALLGAAGHIRKDRPKLSISVYHGYDDLWRLPKLIHQMVPDYRFYLRYYGGNLIPTEIVLTALPRRTSN